MDKENYSFEDFCEVMDVLLGENGCSWDKVQTHDTLMPQFLEECYEVIDAVKNKDNAGICEELGDVLLHVVFNAKIAQKDGNFDMSAVVDGIAKKMIHRHPHIFNKKTDLDADETLAAWDDIKKKEKGYTTVHESMMLIPKSFPALLRAQKVLGKSEKAGYEKVNSDDMIDAAINALHKLKGDSSCESNQKSNEIGDILLKIASISRKFEINSEFALTNAVETYINKFVYIEKP